MNNITNEYFPTLPPCNNINILAFRGFFIYSVSVGTASTLPPPGSILYVNGGVTANIYYGDGGALSNIQSSGFVQPLANLVVSNSVTTTNVFASGQVGIGTSTPGAPLDVVSTNGVIAQFGDGTNQIQIIKSGIPSINSTTFLPISTAGVKAGTIGPSDGSSTFNFSDDGGSNFHNQFVTSDQSVGRYALAVTDNNGGDSSLYPQTMVNFTRQENDGHGAFHLEFVNQGPSDYGVGLGFLDGASSPSPFIMSIHNPYNDSAFNLSNTAGDVAVSMAMDGTNFVGVNTAAPKSQLSVQSSPIFSLNLLHNFGGDVGVRKSLISDDGNIVAILDYNNELNLWTNTNGVWTSALVSAGVSYFDMTRDGQNVVYQLESDPGVLIYPSGYVDDVEQLCAIAYGGSSNVFVATLNNSRVYSFDGSNWNSHDFTTDFTYAISASDDGVYAAISNAYGTYQFSNVSGTWQYETIGNSSHSAVSMSSDGQVICEYGNIYQRNKINIYRNKIPEFTFKGSLSGNEDYSPFLSKDGNTFSYRFYSNGFHIYLYKYRNGQWVPCRPQVNARTVSLNYDASKLMGDSSLYSVSYSSNAFNVDDSLVVSNGDITTPAFYTATGSLFDQGTQKETADSTAVSSDGSLVAYGSLVQQNVKIYKNKTFDGIISHINPYKIAINNNVLAVGTGSGGVSFGDYKNPLKTITLDESILSPSLSSDGATMALGGSNVYVNKSNTTTIPVRQLIHDSRSTSVSSDGHWVAFGNHISRTVMVYNDGVQFGQTITSGSFLFGAFVSLNKDGSTLAIGGALLFIYKRDRTGWVQTQEINTGINTVYKPCLSDDGTRIVFSEFYQNSISGDNDTTVYGYNTVSGNQDWTITLSGSIFSVQSVISGDGTTVGVFYFDLDTSNLYLSVYNYVDQSQISSTFFSPGFGNTYPLRLSVTRDGQTFCASWALGASIYDQQCNLLQTLTLEDIIISSAISGDGQTLILGNDASTGSGQPVLVYKLNETFVSDSEIQSTSGIAYFGEEVAIDYSGNVISITADNGTNLGNPTGYNSLIATTLPLTKLTFDQIPSQIVTPASRGTAVSSDGHWVAFGNHVSKTVQVYKDGVQFGSTITEPDINYFGAFVSLNKDGSVLAVAGGNGASIFSRTQTGWNFLRFMDTGFDTLVKPCLSGDGNHVILGAFYSGSNIGGGDHDTTVRAFNTVSGELDWSLPTATGEYNSIRTVISGDGNTAVIFYLDNDTYTNYIKVYDYSGPVLVSQTSYQSHYSLLSLSVTHDGQTICASDLKVIKIFDRQLTVIQIVPHPLNILSSAMSGDGQTLIVGQQPFGGNTPPYPVLVYKKQLDGSFVQETSISPLVTTGEGFGEEVAIDYYGSTVSITEDSYSGNLGDPTGYSSLIVFLKNAAGHQAVVTGDGSKIIVTNTSLYSARVYDPLLTYWSVLDVIPSSQYNASTNFDGTIININSQVFTQIPNFNQLVPVPPFSNISTTQGSNSFTVVSQFPVNNWTISGINDGSLTFYHFSLTCALDHSLDPTVVTVNADTNGSVNFIVSFI